MSEPNTSRYAILLLGGYYAVEDRQTGKRVWRGRTLTGARNAQKRFSLKLKKELEDEQAKHK